jgi:hypothetical protein
VIRDLKDQGLAHFPSGQYAANNAWTVIAALAHNLGRWVTQIGLPDQPVQTARSRRRHLLQIPGRLTHTSRRWTLRMPSRWPWQHQFTTVLNTLRALPAPHLTTPPAATRTSRPAADPARSPLRENPANSRPSQRRHPREHQTATNTHHEHRHPTNPAKSTSPTQPFGRFRLSLEAFVRRSRLETAPSSA